MDCISWTVGIPFKEHDYKRKDGKSERFRKQGKPLKEIGVLLKDFKVAQFNPLSKLTYYKLLL